jgi:hypothetical protein
MSENPRAVSVIKYIIIILLNNQKDFLLPNNSFRVKDGSGALYGFVPKGKTIKAGTYSLTRSGEEG